MEGQNRVVLFQPHSRGEVIYTAPHDTIGSVVVSRDGGYSWSKLRGQALLEPNGRNYARQIWIDPMDTNVVLVGSGQTTVGVYRSSDAGYNWTQVLPQATILGESIFEVLDGSGLLFCGVSGESGLFKSFDRGISWDSVGQIEGGPSICVVAARPGSGTEFLSGTGGGQISKSTDAGKSWRVTHEPTDPPFSDVPMIAYDPINTSIVLATLYNFPGRTLLKSSDAGETWRSIDVPLNQWALEIDQKDPRNVFMGRFSALDTVGGSFFLSSDGGETWQDLGMDSITDIWQIDYDTASGRIAMATSNGIFIGETRPKSVDRPLVEIAVTAAMNYATQEAVLSAPNGTEIEIYDLNGKKLLAAKTVEGSCRVEVAGWPIGVYFAHFRHDNGYAIRRLTVLR
jgi:photosystem II stability/assembly factor-like uncharacterized protein